MDAQNGGAVVGKWQTIKTRLAHCLIKTFQYNNNITIIIYLCCRELTLMSAANDTANYIVDARAITHAICSKVSAIPEHYVRPLKFIPISLSHDRRIFVYTRV